jgi:nitrile hydratase subunit beta
VNGVHDMGGMHGFGRVPIERGEPAFHASWEGRVLAMQVRMRGWYHLDEFRNAIERMPAARYLDAGYYERWLTALETLLVEKGVVTPGELATGQATTPAPEVPPRPPGNRPPLWPRFNPADRVVARNVHPGNHTRMPRYVRGRRGVVRSVNGPYLLPDTNAHGGSRDWEPVYAVEFWGKNGNDTICVDLWESYLEADV